MQLKIKRCNGMSAEVFTLGRQLIPDSNTRSLGRANQSRINELEMESVPCLMPFLISARIILLRHSLIVRAPLKIIQLKAADADGERFFLIASASFVTKPAMPLMPKSCRDSGMEVS